MTTQQRLVLAVAVLGSFVAFLDGTVVNVALPAIAREARRGPHDAAMDRGCLPGHPRSAHPRRGRRERRRTDASSSSASGSSASASPRSRSRQPSIELLIAARATGVAGAFLVPSSLALITGTDEPVRSRAIGIWTALTTGAMIVGPLLGGIIVDTTSWRWVFLINVLPIGVALALLTRLDLRDERRPGAKIDWIGAALCTAGLGLAVLALIELPATAAGDPATVWLWIALVVGILLFAGFVLRQRTVGCNRSLPLDLFRSRTFSTGTSPPFSSTRRCRSTASSSRSTCSRAPGSRRRSPVSRACRRPFW